MSPMDNKPEYQDLQYQDIAFDSYVRRRQESLQTEIPRSQDHFEIEPAHQKLIKTSSHFFLSTVTGAGWPYVQHRGGPEGFVHVLNPLKLGWLEFHGNNQFVNTGNVDRDSRVCMFFIDYATRKRLKLFGTAQVIEKADDPKLMDTLRQVNGREIRSPYERAMVVDIISADSNCSKYIKPRYTKEQVDERIDLYRQDIKDLKQQVEELNAQVEQLQAQLGRA
ncbi:pyridoxamine 5'-phosphate oxidase family protein [Corynebacterium amycolatum]|uniref:pyridoxamine 5'-phosphate oxidase family protein n=1 Tax=Corynebacterium amycolatum TaxID=43765 RepID=UPI003B5A8D56